MLFPFTGSPIRDKSKGEEEMPMSNWTRLADEWLASRTNVAKQLEVTILPFTDSVRELPPTAETFIVNGTSPDQLQRVRKFFFLLSHYIVHLMSD